MTARVKSVVFGPLPPPPGGISSIGAWLQEGLAGEPDVAFHPIVNKGGSQLLQRSAQNLWRLFHAIRGTSPEGPILLFASSGASFFEKCLWVIVCAAMGRRAKIVMVDGHFPGFWGRRSAGLRRVVRQLFRVARVTIVAQSDTWKSWYAIEFPGQRIEVVGATADDEFFWIGDARVARTDIPVSLLYVGWVIRAKGIHDLLLAASRVKSKFPEFHLNIVGPIYEDPTFWSQEIARLDLGRQVTLCGPITDRAVLLGAYAKADIFTFPSHAEGFPVALVEAAASGLACISTSVGGAPDILAHGRAGSLVDPGQPDQLAEQIMRLLEHPAERAALGRAAHQWASEQFSPTRCLGSYRRVLELDRNP
jgi:glycosyltransferase involved in cell wall biosynthesis